MKLKIVQGDILEFKGDAIVNPANPKLQKGGGLCGAIFRTAGKNAPKLANECSALAPVGVGNAVCTKAYGLPCKHIIHAVGVKWIDGLHGEEILLYATYKNALGEAVLNGFSSVAFPLISSGIYNYPKLEAFREAVGAITDFISCNKHDLQITLYVNDSDVLAMGRREYPDLFEGKA
jgi:O-acetyl-ADP-ribose deacetylase (regulator of RNase III)